MRISRIAVFSSFLMLMLFTPSVPAEDDATSPAAAWRVRIAPVVDGEIRMLMQDREYAKAVTAIDAAMKTDDAPREYLAYLKGRALHLDGKYAEAVAAFDAALKASPDGPWARKTRFAKAASLVGQRDFAAAETIYRAEAEHLLSVERRQEIADIYLEFADEYFKPTDEEQAPDYELASEFYALALEIGPKDAKRVEVELLLAQCDQEIGDNDSAINRYKTFLEAHADDPLAVEARFRLGQCQMAAERKVEARRAWQDLLALHEDSSSERIAEAAFHLAETWSIPAPSNDEDLSLGVAALEAFLERFPSHEKASTAHLRIAQSYFSRSRFDDATAAAKRFLADERYKDDEETPEARCLLGSAYRQQGKFDEAIDAWREYLTKHPTDQAWSDVQRNVIRTEYLKAMAAYEEKRYDDALRLWSEYLVKYPLDDSNPQILFFLGEMKHAQEDFDGAIAEWRRLVSKHPTTDPAGRAQLRIAQTYEEDLHDLAKALEEYKKVTWSGHQGPAEASIARLTEKTLEVATDRIHRSDETPKVRVVTRNIEKLDVRAYKIDMETYFRKMHLAGDVESLDVALIDPDVTFTYEIPDYEEHRLHENAIEIALPDDATNGVMAVTIASEEQEATTLLIQSDMDILVKSSREEAFVFAENMLTGEAWPGARVLLSDGRQVFVEGETDKDGVFRVTVDEEADAYKELLETGDVRVFAIDGGHMASNFLGLSDVGVSTGLTDRGYIYTDRPAYRAGQFVHLRGVFRRAEADRFTIEEGKNYDVDVYDNRGRLIHHESVDLGPFGSFHAHFQIPKSSPSGEYRIAVYDNDSQSHQGRFTVHEYKLEPIKLEIDAERTVLYRGESIEGVIRAAFYYGAPLAGRAVRYQIAGDPRVHEAETDDDGQVAFELPTRELQNMQTIVLRAWMPERNLSTAKNFILSPRGFTLSADTFRDVYISGESFEVTTRASDAEGEPVARDLSMKVYRQTVVDGKTTERLVESLDLATNEEGVARKTLALDEAGAYTIRVEGTDRFGNVIVAREGVTISGEEDRVRLRILADRHTFKVGETADFRLHWREEPALALVTFQGARILEYQLVTLKKGENILPTPVTAALAPNFDLSVAVMTDPRDDDRPKDEPRAERFHEAASPFTVERDLDVVFEIARVGEGEGPIRPGEEVEVAIKTTDKQGNPVAAELSLAMIEQSLLDRFPSKIASIRDFFQTARRQSFMRTGSSIRFEYHPATHDIASELLAERARERYAEIETEETLAVRGDQGWGYGGGYGGTAGGYGGYGEGQSGDRPAGAPGDPYAAMPSTPAITATPPITTWADTSEARGNAPANHRYIALNGNMDGVELGVDFDSDFALIGDQVTAGTSLQYIGKDGAVQQFAFQSGKGLSAMENFFLDEAFADATLLPLLGPQETGYWNPSIVTDDSGEATVQFTMPDRSTAWRLLAVGLSKDTLAGEASRDVAVKKDLFAEMKLPAALVDGDRGEVGVTVHNEAVDEGEILVTLETRIGERVVAEKKTIAVEARGLHELTFPCDIAKSEGRAVGADGAVLFTLTVEADERREVVNRLVPLRPYGMPVYASAAGVSTSDTFAKVAMPEEMPTTPTSLEILVGPSIERSLLDIVLGDAPACWSETRRLASAHDAATSDLMASLALLKLLNATRDAGSPEAEALDARIVAAIGTLVSSQRDDGAWDWTGLGGDGDQFATARAFWALNLARKAGYKVPDDAYDKTVGYLQTRIAAIANSDYESKAILLFSLSTGSKGDFALANRLYRERNSLSPAALAHLALAFAEMDRDPTAKELLDLLGQHGFSNVDNPSSASVISLPWSGAPAELRALYALGLQAADPTSPRLKETVDVLLAERTGHRWSPDKATGPATLALAAWYGEHRFQGEHYKLQVLVNGQEVETLDMDETARAETVRVPADLLAEGEQRVDFRIVGRGRFTYQCVLGGFVAADKLKSTTSDWTVERIYEPAPLEVDGEEVPRGFGILTGGYTSFRNPLTQLPVGKRGLVELKVRRRLQSDIPNEALEYLVVTEPIPAGASVVEQSIRGDFDRYEIGPSAITFHIGAKRSIGPIHYELHGYLPGEYRAAPTVARSAYRPERIVVAEPKALTILPIGAVGEDDYRLTPVELFELGKRAYAKDDWPSVREHLTELLDSWNLGSSIYKEAVDMLFDAHLETGPPEKIVHFFEIIKEKWPTRTVPFDDIVRVGAAYEAMGEHERAYLVFRATIESSFRRESGVAGFLDAQGEFIRSVDVMRDIQRAYPPEGYVAEAAYALAQRVYAKAPEAFDDEKLLQGKFHRVTLIAAAQAMLESFLTEHPDDPAADHAAFATANALLDLEDYENAAAACARYADRYAESDLLDSFWYIIGYCRFAQGRHEDAIAMCRKVADRPADARKEESDNRHQAIYIIGQVHHSQGEAAEAIEAYEQVREHYADAAEAIEYFQRKAIELDEVTTIRPGDPADVELRFRNIATCDVKVYRIDLLKFSLMNRSLQRITGINLAGIRPHYEGTLELGDGRDYRDRVKKMTLDLEEEGAYLVVCRGDDLHASGLVLVSPLELEVQEDAASGRIRTTVKDLASDAYVADVDVRVIGTHNDSFTSGETDLRGVFIADQIAGRSTIIARDGASRYAFFRGETPLGMTGENEYGDSESGFGDFGGEVMPSAKGVLLQGVKGLNRQLQEQQLQEYNDMYVPAPSSDGGYGGGFGGGGVDANAAF